MWDRYARSLHYEIEPAGAVGRIRWLGEADFDAAALVKQPEREPEKRNGAEEWLAEALEAGPRPARQLYDEAEEAGIAKRTLDRAKGALGVKPTKRGFQGAWAWELPKVATKEVHPATWQPLEKEPIGQGARNVSIFRQLRGSEWRGAERRGWTIRHRPANWRTSRRRRPNPQGL